MVGFGSQIQGVQGDEPGEAVMLDGSGNVPGGGSGEWIEFTDWDDVPDGALVKFSTTRFSGITADSWDTPPTSGGASADATTTRIFIKGFSDNTVVGCGIDFTTHVDLVIVNNDGTYRWMGFNGGGVIVKNAVEIASITWPSRPCYKVI